jgi:hypothetical protein
MKQIKQYRYIGRNGIITSNVLLDGIARIDMMRLEAAPGFILTDGEHKSYVTTVEIDESHKWYEIVDNTRKD